MSEYAERDLMELEPHYSRHVSAMTGESLHSKSDIAAELAWRDQQIAELRARLADAEAAKVPAGWRFVPIEPTDAMLDAGNDEASGGSFAKYIYRAMLAAAPTLAISATDDDSNG